MVFTEASSALATLLNENRIQWAFGGSCLLFYLGEPITPRDLDVVVRLSDVEAAKDALLTAGAELLEEKASGNTYLTKKFYTLKWGEVEVDLMAAPGIQRGDEVFRINFDEKGPWKTVYQGHVAIYLCDPADWMAYYRLMENRALRVEQLRAYL